MWKSTILYQIITLVIMEQLFVVKLSASEGKCNQLMTEVQLLEKMVRMEFLIENMEREVRKMVGDVGAKLAQIKGAASGDLGDISIEYIDPNATTLANLENKTFERYDALFEGLRNDTIPTIEKKYGELLRLEEDLQIPNVAFSAISVRKSPLAKRDPVIFKAIMLNDGAGYSIEKGYFTAPISGVYYFTSQLCINEDKDLEYAIKVDDRRIISGEFRMPKGSNDGKCTAFTGVAIVRQRQKVSVQGWGARLFDNDNDWNSFAGFLLYKID